MSDAQKTTEAEPPPDMIEATPWPGGPWTAEDERAYFNLIHSSARCINKRTSDRTVSALCDTILDMGRERRLRRAANGQ